ncbi:MAG: hypothetical protein JW814_03360 [Candidatus Krumholzibacteriota bacterium]|nr:hypothetical protein [Candidatus Krumholzibacteriota bacterium]
MKRSPGPIDVFLLLLFFILHTDSCLSRTWYVTIPGGGDAPTIQAAIDSAIAGDIILVGPGTYTWTNQGTGDYRGMVRFLERDQHLTLKSEMGAEVTIIDAEYQNRVIYCHGLANITVDGFTLTRGDAPDFGDYVGGGFFTHKAAEVVKNCIFYRNRAEWGAGISCVVNEGFFRAENCVFIENDASRFGGGLALANGDGTIDVSDCVFIRNTALNEGGGLVMFNCRADAFDLTFYGNEAENGGSAICIREEAYLDLVNATICHNRSTGGGTVSCWYTGEIDLSMTIIAFNFDPPFSFESGSAGSIGCSDIYGNLENNNIPAELIDEGTNISLNPLFCGSSGSGNYYLRSDSPCFPLNRPDGLFCPVIGAWPVGCGSISAEKASWGKIKNIIHRQR